MASSGYGLTLTGSSTGAIEGDIQDVTVGGITVDFSEIKQVGDVNRIPEMHPMTVREGTMEVTMTYIKTIYATLRSAAIARTEETWTLVDSESSTHIGLGFVSGVTGRSLNTDGHDVYTVSIQPKTSWPFTA